MVVCLKFNLELSRLLFFFFFQFNKNIFKNVNYVSKKARKTKEEIKKDLEEWIINGEKNENKGIEERKCEDAVTVVEWLKNLRIFF